MKKFVIILSIFLFLSFSMNTITVIAQPQTKTFTQGIYNVSDSNLLIGSLYNVQNTSIAGKSLLLIIDSNQLIQELIRLEPNSPKYLIKPLQYGYTIVIIGDGNLVFS